MLHSKEALNLAIKGVESGLPKVKRAINERRIKENETKNAPAKKK